MDFSDFIVLQLAYFLPIVAQTAVFWLPLPLVYIAWKLWVFYKRLLFHSKLKYYLLEIKLPREIGRSPLAMEVVLAGLHNTTGESNWYDAYILGKSRAEYSLEIASIEGDVRFYIWTREKYRKHVESQIYSQYPNAEVKEVSDYTELVTHTKKGDEWAMFATEWKLSQPDPLPIKTYVDYQTDKDVFESKKVDPLTPILEYLGGMTTGEYGWIQIIIRANKGKKDKTSYWKIDWQGDAKGLIEEIMKNYEAPQGEGDQTPPRFIMTPGDKIRIEAIQRSIGKLGFDCGIRALYVAKKEKFNPGNIGGLFGTMKQFNSNDLNGFAPRYHTDFDYPWQDYKGIRMAKLKWAHYDGYRRRSMFFYPYERKPFVLSTEELATLFHFPGEVAETPTFTRIESKKGEPPPNLPI